MWLTMMIMKAIEFFFTWFSEANVKNYECPFKLQFPSPNFNMIMS